MVKKTTKSTATKTPPKSTSAKRPKTDPKATTKTQSPKEAGSKGKTKKGKGNQTPATSTETLAFTQEVAAGIPAALLNMGLNFVKEGCPKRPQHPSLVNTAVQVLNANGDGQLILTTTDMAIAMKAIFSLNNVTQEGSVLLPTDILTGIANKAEGDLSLVGLVAESNGVKSAKAVITDKDKGSIELRGMPFEEFPTVESHPSISTLLGSKIALTALKAVSFAMSSSDQKPTLQSVRWQIANNFLTVCASDGAQIAICKVDLMGIGRRPKKEKLPNFTCLVPAKLVRILEKLLAGVEVGNELLAGVNAETGKITFELVDELMTRQIISSQATGEYPDVEAVITAYRYPKTLEVSKGELLKKLERIMAVGDPKNAYQIVMSVLPESRTLKIDADFQDTKASQEVEISSKPTHTEQMSVKLNVFYFHSVIKGLPSSNVEICMDQSFSPVLIKPSGAMELKDVSLDLNIFVMPIYDQAEAAKKLQEYQETAAKTNGRVPTGATISTAATKVEDDDTDDTEEPDETIDEEVEISDEDENVDTEDSDEDDDSDNDDSDNEESDDEDSDDEDSDDEDSDDEESDDEDSDDEDSDDEEEAETSDDDFDFDDDEYEG